jgi:hypothetical protein
MPTLADPQMVAVLTMTGTLLGIVLGFGLNEASYYLRTRREDRRTISKTLAELLEVRHVLRYLPLAVQTLKKILPTDIPAHDEVMLRNFLWTFLPNVDGMQKRYEDAVSAVAAFLPVLAFDLRSKDMIGPLLGRLRSTLPIQPAAAPIWLKMEDQLVSFSLPKLEELIQELAELHGIETAEEVRARLEEKFEPLQELEKFFREILSATTAQAAQAQASKAPANPTTNS